MLAKFPTMDSLQKRGFYLPSICLLCYQEAELVSHLLSHCLFSWEIWCSLSDYFGMTFIAPMDLSSLLFSWGVTVLSLLGKRVWRLVPAAICWAIWRERNNQVFNGFSKPAWQMVRRAKELVVFWAKRCKGFEGVPNGDLLRHWASVIGKVI